MRHEDAHTLIFFVRVELPARAPRIFPC